MPVRLPRSPGWRRLLCWRQAGRAKSWGSPCTGCLAPRRAGGSASRRNPCPRLAQTETDNTRSCGQGKGCRCECAARSAHGGYSAPGSSAGACATARRPRARRQQPIRSRTAVHSPAPVRGRQVGAGPAEVHELHALPRVGVPRHVLRLDGQSAAHRGVSPPRRGATRRRVDGVAAQLRDGQLGAPAHVGGAAPALV